MAQKTTSHFVWHRPHTEPPDKALCMIIVNAKLLPDVFIYRAKGDLFFVWNVVDKDITEMVVKRVEVDAWMNKTDIPLPKWVQ